MGSRTAVPRIDSQVILPAKPFNWLPWATTACLLAADLVASVAVFWSAIIWRHFLTPQYQLGSILDFVPCMAMLIGAFYIQGLYPGVLLHPAEEMRRVFLCVSLTFLILGSTTFIWRTGASYSRSVYVATWVISSPVIIVLRYLTRLMCSRKAWWGVSAVVFGSGATAQRVLRALQSGMLGIKVVGVLVEDHIDSWAPDLPPVLGRMEDAPNRVRSGFAQYAIVALPRKDLQLHHAIQDYCRGFGHVLLIPDLRGLCSLGISAREVGGEVGLEVPQRLFQNGSALAKGLLDMIAALIVLIAVAPIFLLIAMAVKLTSRGPVFYGHPRLGRRGKTFKALKFRTMVVNSDRVLTEYFKEHPGSRKEWERDFKLKCDPRVTRVGRVLRRLSLDELPQLLNVIVGHMSLVGPRPIVKAEIEKYGRSYDLYSRVLPGITGLWQVSGRNNTTYAERVQFDEYYVRNWSVWLDVYILVRTVGTVLSGDGAY